MESIIGCLAPQAIALEKNIKEEDTWATSLKGRLEGNKDSLNMEDRPSQVKGLTLFYKREEVKDERKCSKSV